MFRILRTLLTICYATYVAADATELIHMPRILEEQSKPVGLEQLEDRLKTMHDTLSDLQSEIRALKEASKKSPCMVTEDETQTESHPDLMAASAVVPGSESVERDATVLPSPLDATAETIPPKSMETMDGGGDSDF